jgi:hypothetical protein
MPAQRLGDNYGAPASSGSRPRVRRFSSRRVAHAAQHRKLRSPRRQHKAPPSLRGRTSESKNRLRGKTAMRSFDTTKLHSIFQLEI